MSLAQLSSVTFGYPGNELFEELTWQVDEGVRIGLIGPNGAGKSTILRLLAGEVEAHGGEVTRGRGITIGTLRQSQEHRDEGTVLDSLLGPFARVLAMRAELAELEPRLGDGNAADLDRYGHLQEDYTRAGGYSLESRVRELAASVGFEHETDLARPVATLSGGERGRLELAKVLLAEPDLLLLDEPTNHLDVEHVERLEEFLKTWPKSFVLVSHDRRFLDATCTEIIEVDGGDLEHYVGGFSRYLAEREERRERLRAAVARQQAEIARTEEFIRKNIAGQKTKQAQSRRKMLERVQRLELGSDSWGDAGRIGLRFTVGDHPGGKDALKIEHLTLGYPGGRVLCRDLDTVIYRGDRIGIIGPNGTGKSTLLKALLGRPEGAQAIREGRVVRGVELKIGYFDQKLGGLQESRSLIEEIRSIRGDFADDRARDYLARFRFFGDDPFRIVKGLSGGERNRLALAKMMLEPRNLLALDEPTNHLDIPAREVLERALKRYEGTLLVISHDRFFLDEIVTKLFVMHEDGSVDIEAGNYRDHKARLRSASEGAKALAQASQAALAKAKEKEKERQKEVERTAAAAAARAAGAPGTGSARQRDASKERDRQQKRVAKLETEIATLEAELEVARAALGDDHKGDWQRLNTLMETERKLDTKLRLAMAEWEKLAATLE